MKEFNAKTKPADQRPQISARVSMGRAALASGTLEADGARTGRNLDIHALAQLKAHLGRPSCEHRHASACARVCA